MVENSSFHIMGDSITFLSGDFTENIKAKTKIIVAKIIIIKFLGQIRNFNVIRYSNSKSRSKHIRKCEPTWNRAWNTLKARVRNKWLISGDCWCQNSCTAKFDWTGKDI